MILKRSLCLMATYGLLQLSQLSYAADSSEMSTEATATPAVASEPASMPETSPSPSAETSQSKDTETMGRDIWLEKLKMGAPNMICKNFSEEADIGKVMQSKDISVEKCMALITPITEECENKYRNSIPDPVNEELASTWGRKIGECIGGQFATQYLYPENDTTGTTPTQQTAAPAPATAESSAPKN